MLYIVVIYGKSRAKRKQRDNLTTSSAISGLYIKIKYVTNMLKISKCLQELNV